MGMYLQTVLLTRFSKGTNLKMEELMQHSEGDAWLALGHYDAIFTFPAKQLDQSVFDEIQKNSMRLAENSDNYEYYHPVYLVTKEDNKNFWNSRAVYFGIIRVHLKNASQVGTLFNALRSKISNNWKRKSFKYVQSCSLELSDMIIAMKGDNLNDILKSALLLKGYQEVGKIQSFFGIHYETAFNLGETSLSVISNEKIDFLMMRFSVKEANLVSTKMDGIRDVLKSNTYYTVTGIDDITFVCSPIYSHDLLRLYSAWSNELPLGSAFFSITTQLGIGGFPSSVESVDRDIKLRNVVDKLINDCNRASLALTNKTLKDQISLKTIRLLTKSLLNICIVDTLDEFAYVLIPGVRAFYENLVATQQGQFQNRVLMSAEFVDSWSYLTEQIVRAEGQLSNRSEMLPIIFDTPIIMLELILALLGRAEELLQEHDTEKRRIEFFLVPRMCDRIKANEIYAASGERSGLILISLPLETFQKSAETQIELLHELSHFAGERFRNRQKRKTYYIYSIAVLMAKAVFNTHDNAFIDALIKILKEKITGEELKIVELHDEINKWLRSILHDNHSFSDFIREIFEHTDDTIATSFLSFDRNQYHSRLSQFEALHIEIAGLYRETYADICMMYLLSLPASSVVNLLNAELEQLRTDENPFRWESMAIRAMAISQTFKQSIDKLQPYNSRFCREIKKLKDGLQSTDEPTDRCIPIGSICRLLEYLSCCYQNICSINQSKLKKFQKLSKGINGKETSFEDLLGYIEKHRRDVIKYQM